MSSTHVALSDTNRRTGRPAWLSPAAAAAYEAMKRDGMPSGCVSDAGRTRAEQQEMWDAYQRGELVATAARPGTSKHETGTAVDLREPARTWAREHGHRYGFIADRVPREPWHLEHDGRTALPAPTATEPEETAPMRLITAPGRPTVLLLTGDIVLPLATPADVAAFNKSGVPTVAVSAATYDTIAHRARAGA